MTVGGIAVSAGGKDQQLDDVIRLQAAEIQRLRVALSDVARTAYYCSDVPTKQQFNEWLALASGKLFVETELDEWQPVLYKEQETTTTVKLVKKANE